MQTPGTERSTPLPFLRPKCSATPRVLPQASGMQVVEIAPRTRRGRFLMAHIIGYIAGCVLAAVLAFAVADQSNLGVRKTMLPD